ncbi:MULTISPECIES: DNA-3-methyladenine glycosylase [Micrococcaceae]|uniref:DNA-3-methyladenine glycosylase n=1 Tax=Micrococcaceae TaxID=1268 RepID=UPI0016153EBE|nr:MULTISPECIES: DNA-3-methyladenine glycosylase [Micrococcaceae]MBB5749269.1 DNA-3-methyladenine glycosylase [Micrococcus sp. TA1]HRO30231.1 DNA-3-methyladenine glycosylase [Citricoccus sp.]HRO93150.1 DNA-3-methyladenine glycosylase [Citricoccus sp.]
MPGDLSVLERGGLRAAPLLLGSTLTVARGGTVVGVRLTEVEAYEGQRDPGSHAYRGRSRRNDTMFGPAGHVYVYFTYGMHWCMNIVCGTEGTSSAVLLRAGEVTLGLDAAVARRGAPAGPRLASGPARLAQALGIGAGDDGSVLLSGPGPDDHAAQAPDGIWLSGIRSRRRPGTLTGPRTGVSGPGGGPEFPWRFWLPDEPSVSPYRPAAPRRRTSRA